MLRQEVIREIIKREHQKKGLTNEIVLREDQGLHEAGCEHFGIWDTALHYAGIDIRRLKAVHAYDRNGVTKAIRKLCVGGYSVKAGRIMQRNRQLYRAALEHFGTWTEALLAAGIDPTRLCQDSKPRQHDRQKIIDDLIRRHQSGQSLTWSDVCLENRPAATAAKHVFGSWRKALMAAGISPELYHASVGRKWNQQRVIAVIQERHRQKKPLTSSAVIRDYAGLFHAGRRYFGQWGKALEAAGITSEKRAERKKKDDKS